MTNNPTIDGVSRELLEQSEAAFKSLIANITEEDEDGDYWRVRFESRRDQLRALLDADHIVDSGKMVEPVADRQGHEVYAWVWIEMLDGEEVNDGISYGPNKPDFKSRDGTTFECAPLYTDKKVTSLQSTIAQLQARIDEMESGRGDNEFYTSPENLKNAEDGRGAAFWSKANAYEGDLPLFTAPPAPVAVVLPECNNASKNLSIEQCGYVDGWNDCLDATAALNGDRG